MDFKYTFCILSLLISALLFSQSKDGFDPTSPLKNSIGIHQFELEKYQNFRASQEPDDFVGQPVPLALKSNPPSREIFGYLPYWTYPSYPILNYDLLTTVAYFGAELNGSGNITDLNDWPAAGLINKAHSEGVRVVLTAILFNSSQLSTLLSNPANRANCINNLLTQVQNAGADGVTIDFEGVPGSQKQNLTDFMSELTTAFHSSLPGSFVTIFTPAVDWNNAFDYSALGQITDGLIMQGYDYHWGGGPTAGPTAPLTGTRWGFFNVTWTVNDYLTKTSQNAAKLILSVPYFGFEWITADDTLESPTLAPGNAIFYSEAYPNAMQHGRLWDQESQTPWYRYNDGMWHQGWYDDSLSLALKYNFVNQQDLKGIAIWALDYDGSRLELQEALLNAFGSTAPPLQPTNFRIANIGNGDVRAEINSPAGATSYKLYSSTDGQNFDSGTAFPSSSIVLNNLSMDTTFYFKISALNGNGESNLTEVLAVHPHSTEVDVLIVNGFDRTTGTTNTFDFIRRFAPSVVKAGRAFDACANEAIEDQDILLTDYDVVIWISGEEGTADESFSSSEQVRIMGYLENGGQLFISGSEIGYDLVDQGNSNDQIFYRSYFKAQYIRDQVPTYFISGTTGGIFENLANLKFDDGNHGTYNVDYPDGINPIDGSIANMIYDGFDPVTFGGAGIQYEGTFGLGTAPGKIVYLGIPFETLYPASTRDSVMGRVMQFFDFTTSIVPPIVDNLVPDEFELGQNYPNPFNPKTTIEYNLVNGNPLHVQLKIFDILGRAIITLVDEEKTAGRYEIVWNGVDAYGREVASGVYIYQLQVGNQARYKKMNLVR
jgi:spore germination protein YaaH